LKKKIEKQIWRENRNRKSDDTIPLRSSKIIRTQLLKTNFQVERKGVKPVRKAVYDKTEKKLSAITPIAE